MRVSPKSRSSESGPGQWPLLIHFHSSSGHCDLNYKLYGEDVPYRWVGPTWQPSGRAAFPLPCPRRVYENQRIPPLINHVPVRIRRTHAGMGVKGSFGPHKASRNGPLPPRRIQRE